MSDVVDGVAHHDEAGEAQAEGEAIPLAGVDAAHAEDVGVDEAAGEEFHPAALLADRTAGAAADEALDVELETGLNEGKVAGTQAHGHFAVEDGGEQGLHEVEQVGDGDRSEEHTSELQ